MIAILVVGCTAGFAAGRLLRRRGAGQILDAIQGGVGAALCLEVLGLSGPLEDKLGAIALAAVLGAWVAVGMSHATAGLIRRVGIGGRSDDH